MRRATTVLSHHHQDYNSIKLVVFEHDHVHTGLAKPEELNSSIISGPSTENKFSPNLLRMKHGAAINCAGLRDAPASVHLLSVTFEGKC